MARRSLWLAAGVAAGAASSLYVERKLKQTLEAASARLQPEALVNEVGRSARQVASSTGVRLRGAVATARQEKRRREAEIWAELNESEQEHGLGAHSVPPEQDTAPDPVDRLTEGPGHLSARRARRVRRVTRNSHYHLGK